MRVKGAARHGESPVTTRRYDSQSSSGEFEGLRPASNWGLALAPQSRTQRLSAWISLPNKNKLN